MRSRGCGIYLLIYLLVDEGIAKLRYLKSYSTDDQSHQFVLKCPKVSSTRYHLLYLIYSMGNLITDAEGDMATADTCNHFYLSLQ